MQDIIYDECQTLCRITNALGHSHSYAYDKVGNRISETDARGKSLQQAYDSMNRRIRITNPLGHSRTTEYNVHGLPTRMTDEDSRSTRFDYDNFLRLTLQTDALDNQTLYGYQLLDGTPGSLYAPTVPGEGLITFSQFQWLAPGQITVPGGTRTSRRHDGLLQLEHQHIKTPGQQTVLDLQHTWGKAFELQAVQREQRDGDTLRRTESQYAYDAVLRLTGITTDRGGLFGGTTESLTLDAVANRLAQSTLSGDWIYDANDRLSQRGDVARYVYDDSGNMVQKTEGTRITRYAYDTLNRLVEIRDASASPEGLVARYGYDPMGRRLWKEQFRDRAGQVLSPARRTYFLYADEGLIAEATQAISLGADLRVTASEAPLLTTQYGPKPDSPFTTGVLFVKTRNTKGEDTVAYYHHNHLQTPLLATDKLGRVVWAAEYHPFGAATLITPAASAENPLIVSNLRLPGQYADEESGLYYNWNRYYDPESGRYGSRDPIGLAGGC